MLSGDDPRGPAAVLHRPAEGVLRHADGARQRQGRRQPHPPGDVAHDPRHDRPARVRRRV